jgi:hypothetical protein
LNKTYTGKRHNLGYIKIKNLHLSEDTIKLMRRQMTRQGTFTKHISDKGQESKL